jgi:hypothetical protein
MIQTPLEYHRQIAKFPITVTEEGNGKKKDA